MAWLSRETVPATEREEEISTLAVGLVLEVEEKLFCPILKKKRFSAPSRESLTQQLRQYDEMQKKCLW